MPSFTISTPNLVVLVACWLLLPMQTAFRSLRRRVFLCMSVIIRVAALNFFMRNRILSVVACILVCSLVIMPFSAFADDVDEPLIYDPPQELWDESAVYAIWLILRAWGINITAGEVDEWSQAVSDEIENQVIHYLDSLPSPISIFSWVNPWLWDVDFWGQARFNSSMLEDVQDFAEWLVETLDLSDNDMVIANPIMSVDGTYTLYNFDTWYRVSQDYGYTSFDLVDFQSDTPYQLAGWCIAHSVNTQYYYTVIISFTGEQWQPLKIRKVAYRASDDHYENGPWKNLYMYLPNQNGLWVVWDDFFQNGFLQPQMPDGDYFEFSNVEQLNNFLDNLNVVAIGDLRYVTYDIEFPVDDPDYTAGDSLQIIDNSPVYQLLDWDGHVTVDNLPAVVSKTNLENPGLIELFRPVQAFVTTFSDGLALVRGIVYELPSEAIIILFTLMGCAILIGVIHIMKEH